MTMTIAEIDEELRRLPSSPKTDEDFRARVDLVRRRFDLEDAQRKAEAADLKRAAWESEKRGRYVCYVPDSIGISHLVLGGYNRRVPNADGSVTNGEEIVPVEIENGRRVVRLRSLHDYSKLVRGEQGLAWSNANPELNDARASAARQNNSTIAEPPR